MRQFFKNVHLKAYKEEKLHDALYENYLFNIKRNFFFAFKRFSQKSHGLKELCQAYKTQKRQQTLEDSYFLWKRKYAFEKNLIYLYAKAVICIKDQLQAKCFEVLKRKWINQRKLKYRGIARITNLKQDVLTAWSLLLKKKALLKNLLTDYKKSHHLQIKRIYLHVKNLFNYCLISHL